MKKTYMIIKGKKAALSVFMLLSFSAMVAGCKAAQKEPTKTETAVTVESSLSAQASKEGAETGTTKFPDFSVEDLSGNVVTNDIFTQVDLTVLNVWGTFCGPCIGEMPELAKWSGEMPQNVQIVGIVCDVTGKEDAEQLDEAKQIVEKLGVKFVNLIAEDDFDDLMKNIVGVPTTFFIDKNGTIVGEPILGADVEAYKTFVETYLKEKSGQ